MRRKISAAGAILGMVLVLACGAARGENAPRIEGWDRAQRRFLAWQRDMLRHRTPPSEKRKRILHHRIVVPPPSPAGSGTRGGIWEKIKYRTRFDSRLFDPLGLAPGAPALTVGAGDATVEVAVKAEGKLLNLLLASHDITLFAVGPGSSKAFGDTSTALKAGLLGVPLSRRGGEAEAAWTVLMTGHGLESAGPSAKLGGSYGVVSGGVGVTSSGELQLSAGVGPQLLPENPVAQAKIALEGEVTAPVVVEDLQWASKHGVSQVAGDAAGRIARMVARPVACPYCRRLGEVTCRKCLNRRTITCSACGGSRKAPCRSCGGSGRINCPTTQSCWPCRGNGRLPCATCGGTGRVNVQRQVTKQVWRTYRVPYTAGFDRNGDPVVRYRTEYKLVNIPTWETESVLCSACGGTAWGATCSNCSGSGTITCKRCGGRGWYSCRTCGGTGKVNCRRCRGTGVVTCPNCRGRKIVCPLCKGRKRIGVGR